MTLPELFEKYPHPEYELQTVLDDIIVLDIDGEIVHSEPHAKWMVEKALCHYEQRGKVEGSWVLEYMYGGDMDQALGELHKNGIEF